jgi:hypothetical protein
VEPSIASPAEIDSAGDPLDGPWERLDEQIAWYDRRSAHGKRWYQRLKVAQIVVAAAIPAAAAAGVPVVVAGAMGALIVVLEGLQQLFQYQQNWTAYRSTCEALRQAAVASLGLRLSSEAPVAGGNFALLLLPRCGSEGAWLASPLLVARRRSRRLPARAIGGVY